MAMVNGPNGGEWRRVGEGILETDMRCHRLSRSRGQAIVETALLLPILMLLVMGTADLGRVFYYSIAVTNAAREAARQGTYFDPISNSNAYDTYDLVLAAARNEVPADVTLDYPTGSPSHCLTGSPSSWRVYYPTQPNAGHVHICFDRNDSQSPPAPQTIQGNILYHFSPGTPPAGRLRPHLGQVVRSTPLPGQTQP